MYKDFIVVIRSHVLKLAHVSLVHVMRVSLSLCCRLFTGLTLSDAIPSPILTSQNPYPALCLSDALQALQLSPALESGQEKVNLSSSRNESSH